MKKNNFLYKIVATGRGCCCTLSDCLTIEQANDQLLFCFNYLFAQDFKSWAGCVRYCATRTRPDGTRFFYWGLYRLETQRTTTGELNLFC